MARICVASHHGSLGELRSDPEFLEVSRCADALVELRLDQYSDLSAANLEATIRAFGRTNVLVTYRSPDEGGRNADVTDPQRFFYLSQATTQGAAFVDIELASVRRNPEAWRVLRAARQRETAFVVSFHDFKTCPPREQLRALRREGETVGADVVKMAVAANTIFDSAPLLDLLCETGWKQPFLGLAMGEAGLWSRVLGPRFPTPAPFTFARGSQAPGTAPGQPTWQALLKLYRFPRIQPDWPVYAEIGDPVAWSFAPLMQNGALIEAGLPGVYLPLRVAGDAAAFLREMAPKLGLQGLSVSTPHQETALAACAGLDELARQIGAADTLVRRHENGPAAWEAAHAEAKAAAAGLEEALGGHGTLQGRKVLVLGAGARARTIAYGLASYGTALLIWDRSAEQAAKLSAIVGGKSVLREDLTPDPGVVAVVNTTSIGTHPKVDEQPVELARLQSQCLVFETGCDPIKTEFMRAAVQAGHPALDGLSLLVGQGAVQFERFTGTKAPRELMRRLVLSEMTCRAEGGKRL